MNQQPEILDHVQQMEMPQEIEQKVEISEKIMQEQMIDLDELITKSSIEVKPDKEGQRQLADYLIDNNWFGPLLMFALVGLIIVINKRFIK